MISPKIKRILSELRQAVNPTPVVVDTASETGWNGAMSVWNTEFADLHPVIDDADVLEIGGEDARVSGLLLTARPDGGPARSVVCLGAGGDAGWVREFGDQLQVHADARVFNALETGVFDVVLCRDWGAGFAMEALETGLSRIYDLLRPGGEFLVVVDCADLVDFRPTAKGYGVMTPSSWMMAFQRAGFEVVAERRSLRSLERAGLAQSVLSMSSEDERSTARMRCRLVRPWESWELNVLRSADRGPPT